MTVVRVVGDLFEQPADALVNPWNCNVMPRWWPSSGVSGQLKKRTGPDPWRQLARAGWLRTGAAVVTGAGQLTSHRRIIHVAGLHPWWRASPGSIRASIRAAAEAAERAGLRSVATPLIGAGTGGVAAGVAETIILEELTAHPSDSQSRVQWIVVTRD